MSGARGSLRGLFNPAAQGGIVAGWLRLAASVQSGGEWTSLTDVLNGNPAVQTDADRRATVGSSANGLSTMVFDGSDMYQWPLSPAHSATTKVGIWLWFRPASVTGVQVLYAVTTSIAGATARRLFIFTNGSALTVRANVTDAGGRNGATGSGALTIGAWHAIYLRYDSSLGGDPNLGLVLQGVEQSLTYSDEGSGGTLGALQSSAGSAVIGAQTDTDTPSGPILNGGAIGPNIFTFNENLTAQQIAGFLAFEAPT